MGDAMVALSLWLSKLNMCGGVAGWYVELPEKLTGMQGGEGGKKGAVVLKKNRFFSFCTCCRAPNIQNNP